MKLLMILVDSNHQEDVENLLEDHDVPGFTELPNVLGKGRTGRKMGTRAFPGSSTLYFVGIGDEGCHGLCDRLKELQQQAGPEEGLKAYTIDSTEIL